MPGIELSQSEAPTLSDRADLLQRPAGWPIMHQTWKRLLFLHWPIEVERLRPLIPAELSIDTWEGVTWIGLTPLEIHRMRPVLAPPLPKISFTYELNVRTYVHRDRVPGIWFLSLEASNPLAVWGARLSYFLPYFHASINMSSHGDCSRFHCRRTHAGAPRAELEVKWRRGRRLPAAVPGTLEFYLVERYCLYSMRRGRLYRARIHHRPWPLCNAALDHLSSTIFTAHGLPEPSAAPLLHSQAEPLYVEVWPLRRV